MSAIWFNIYFVLFAVLCLFTSGALWGRGLFGSLKQRVIIAKKQMSKLKIYRGNKHPHEVQNPKEISLVQMNKKNLLRN